MQSEDIAETVTGAQGNAIEIAGGIAGEAGNLYGTTAEGGAFDRGVVFALLPRRQGDASTERVIHSFTGGRGGMAPYGRLTFGQGDALIGTTPTGGNLACGDGNGCGTIFRVVPFRTGTLR